MINAKTRRLKDRKGDWERHRTYANVFKHSFAPFASLRLALQAKGLALRRRFGGSVALLNPEPYYRTRSSHVFSTQPTLASDKAEQFSGTSWVVCQ